MSVSELRIVSLPVVAGIQHYYKPRIVAGQGQGQEMDLEPVGLGTGSASALRVVAVVEQEDIVLGIDLVLPEQVAPTRLGEVGFLAIAAAADSSEEDTAEDMAVE